jgi:hypothetical protein
MEAFWAYCKKVVGHSWFALCYRDFLYHAGGKNVTEPFLITHGALCVDFDIFVCGLMQAENVGEGQPEATGDAGGPSSHHDEDRPAHREDNEIARGVAEGRGDDVGDVTEGCGDDVARDINEGQPNAAGGDQNREV